MVSHNFTFIILGFILLVIGLVLVDSLKNWAFVLMIIGVLVALKGIISMRKRSHEGKRSSKKDSDNVEREEESGKVNEEPEGEDDEAESYEEDHKFCRECGEKISKEAEYCPNCRAEQ